MPSRQKKIILVLIAAVVLFAAGFFYYLFSTSSGGPGRAPFFSSLPFIGKNPLPGAGSGPAGAGQGPAPAGLAQGRLRQIIDKEIFAPALSADEKSILYALRENGHIEARDLDGENPESRSNVTVPHIYDAAWHPKRDRVVLFYEDGGSTKAFVAGVATGTPSRFLPGEAASADWSPDGTLAYFLARPSGSQLLAADAGMKSSRLLYDTPVPDFTVRWLSKRAVLLVSKPSGLAPSLIMQIDPSSKRASTFFSGVHGATVLPSPKGTFVLLGASGGRGELLELASITVASGEKHNLGIKTFPEKCAIRKDETALYCAVPNDEPPEPEPDLWYRGDVSFSDTIVKITLPNGRIEPVGTLPNLDAVSPFLTSNGKYLFFADKKTDTLWRLALDESTSTQSAGR